MERRKIVKVVDAESNLTHYESRKPVVFGTDYEWEKEGRKYNLKGLDSLLRGDTFDFILDSEVQEDLDLFRMQRESRKRDYQK